MEDQHLKTISLYVGKVLRSGVVAPAMALSSPILISLCHLLLARFGTLSWSTFIAHSRGKDKLGVLCFIFFAFCLFLEEGKVYFNPMHLIGLNGTAILIFTNVKNSFYFYMFL